MNQLSIQKLPAWGVFVLTMHLTCGILQGVSGWVRRGGNPRTPSGPRGSSGKEAIPGAAGLPTRAFFI